jgi:cell division protein ZipA
MDASTLRLILIIVGVVLLLGLYLWERERARARDDRDDDGDDWDTFVADKREPNLGALETDESDYPISGAAAGPEARSAENWAAAEQDRFVDDAAASAEDGARAQLASQPAGAPAASTPELLIQLYVVTTGEPFAGEDILAVTRRCKLALGDMDIFHRQASDDPERAPLFSMANLVKPGAFPVEAMDDFETPGLALFAQFTGDTSDIMVYDEMLHTARTLAEELGGEVEERGRIPLTAERAKQLRGQVLALLGAEHGASDGE